MAESTSEGSREVAYFYPQPYWSLSQIDGIKTLLLFFDGVAILLPKYMRGREQLADPVLAGPMAEQGLLRVLEPETFIDATMAAELAEILVELITSGAFDGLPQDVGYAELSRSRIGWDADVELAGMVIDELRERGLARSSEDGVSVPLHPAVRQTVLVLLSQLARPAGMRQGLSLHPTTGSIEAVGWLVEMLARAQMPSSGHLVELDLQTVSVDLSSVPLDEVLAFRKDHSQSYRAYARDLRRFVAELSLLDVDARRTLIADREEELLDRAGDLRRATKASWRLPFANFALGAAGAAWEASQGDYAGAALALAAGAVGGLPIGRPTGGAYSYLFAAQRGLAR